MIGYDTYRLTSNIRFFVFYLRRLLQCLKNRFEPDGSTDWTIIDTISWSVPLVEWPRVVEPFRARLDCSNHMNCPIGLPFDWSTRFTKIGKKNSIIYFKRRDSNLACFAPRLACQPLGHQNFVYVARITCTYIVISMQSNGLMSVYKHFAFHCFMSTLWYTKLVQPISPYISLWFVTIHRIELICF